MAEEQRPAGLTGEPAQEGPAPHWTEATPPKVPGAEGASVSAWAPGTAAEAAPGTPMPPAVELVHDDAAIADIQAQVDVLRREIDRLAGLVDTAAKRLKENG